MKSTTEWESTKRRLTSTMTAGRDQRGYRYIEDVPDLVEEVEGLRALVASESDEAVRLAEAEARAAAAEEKYRHSHRECLEHMDNAIAQRERAERAEKLATETNAALTRFQTHSTANCDETRGLRRLALPGVASERMAAVLSAIVGERYQQDAKWGVIDDEMVAMPNGTGPTEERIDALSQARRDYVDYANIDGLNLSHILTEEFCEAMAESDEGRLAEELIQVAACAVKWLEILAIRKGAR